MIDAWQAGQAVQNFIQNHITPEIYRLNLLVTDVQTLKNEILLLKEELKNKSSIKDFIEHLKENAEIRITMNSDEYPNALEVETKISLHIDGEEILFDSDHINIEKKTDDQ
jgi:hypothetical protein